MTGQVLVGGWKDVTKSIYLEPALRECPVCHWHGVPTFRNGQIQRECPSCRRPVITR